MEKSIVVQAILFGAIVTGIVILGRKLKKDSESKSEFCGKINGVSRDQLVSTYAVPTWTVG